MEGDFALGEQTGARFSQSSHFCHFGVDLTMTADQPPQPPMDTKPMSASSIRYGPLGVARVIVGLFSCTSERDPPSQHKTEHLRLITIAQSHFCEKARWALDLLENDPDFPIYYTEDGHPPAFVAFETLPR